VYDLGKVSATGFWSTGFILSFPDPSNPDAFQAVKLTFPTAGTYTYKCLVHPDMEGTVKVG
jgi:plastocyanin